MTIALKNANFAKSTLGGNITDVATVLTVASAGDAALFPSTGTMRCVIWSGSLATPMQDTTREFVTMTFSSSVTFSPVVRGREGTTGKAWSTGDCIALVISAGKINELEADINTASGHLDQDVKQASSPTFVGETLSGLTASLPVFTGASKELISKSVADTRAALGEVVWTDYAASSTIVGWSSFTSGRKWIYTHKIGTLVFVSFHLEGTSNDTVVTFTLPYASSNTSFQYIGGAALSLTYDNTLGKTPAGKAVLPPNSSTVTCYSDGYNGAWTASGTKIVTGTFWYEAAS